MREAINAALKDAMKSGDKARTGTLRLINAAFKDRDIEARGSGKGPLGDDDLLGVLQKMVKQRQESADLFDKGGRAELAAQERAEIEIIKGFMPAQLDAAETEQAVTDVIAETGATNVREMGRVMAVLKERYSGRMDFGKAGPLVKARLG